MATERALNHLHALVKLSEEADRRITGLATTLAAVNDQIDAIIEDSDRDVSETVAESYSPGQLMQLAQGAIKEDSVTLFVSGSPVGQDTYSIDYATGVITPNVEPGDGVTITAKYTVMGLASQVVQILQAMPGLSAQDFLNRKDSYAAAINWIHANYGE